jgi:cytidine deaminase
MEAIDRPERFVLCEIAHSQLELLPFFVRRLLHVPCSLYNLDVFFLPRLCLQKVSQVIMTTATELLEHARIARQQAYAPYSNYLVGAALLTAEGSVIYGCNVENASYPATLCAERVALGAAIAQGQRDFQAIAVVTRNGGTPCGVCRQVMAELGPNMMVYIGDEQGLVQTTTVAELLPGAFVRSSLLSSDDDRAS